MKGTKVSSAALIALLFIAIPAAAAPIVSYNVSGMPGNWVLDFSVTNTLGDNNKIYFFGVLLPQQHAITAMPLHWDDRWITWDNSAYGGSSIVYNNTWINVSGPNFIENGQTMSGFQVTLTVSEAPSSVPWFAYAAYGTYTGNDYFHNDFNPGFEGTAGGAAIPLPAALYLLAPGLAGIVAVRKRSSREGSKGSRDEQRQDE